jgi:hypothetical protein
MNKVKTSDPNKTRGGRIRIKGFQRDYLMKMLEETSRPKEKARIKKRLVQAERRENNVR